MKLEKIQATARLQETYLLWHKAAEEYENPNGFRTYLNACIQAIRNVTFVLQKQKSEIENFDTWYSEWQVALKNDRIMRWCVDARNYIVKIGDLENQSLAIASYVTSYLSAPKHIFKVNPFTSTNQIAQEIYINFLPDELKNDGYLVVERRWITADLPGLELLEVLAYAFSVLTQMLLDVERRNGPDLSSLRVNIEDSFQKNSEAIRVNKTALPACMAEFENYRTKWLKLPSLEVAALEIVSANREDVTKEKVLKRYGEFASLSEEDKNNLSPLRQQAILFFRQAKIALKKDKHLLPVAFLLNDNNEIHLIELAFEDYESKYLVWDTVAKEVIRNKSTAIITIGEIWSAPLNPNNPKMRPVDSPERRELIQVVALSKNGESFAMGVPFYKRWGRIYFKEEFVYDECDINFLKPIQRAWGLF